MCAHRLLGYVLRTTAMVNGAWYAAYFLALPLLIERAASGPGGTGLGAYGLIIAGYGSTNLAATIRARGRPSRPGRNSRCSPAGCSWAAGIVLLGFAALLPPPRSCRRSPRQPHSARSAAR